MKKFLRKIRDYLFVLIDFCGSHVRFEHTANSLIIVKTDAIGDYILFRNFLEILRDTYPKHHITFLGNIAYKDFAQTLDGKFIDTFIWLDRKAFLKNPLYRIKFIANIAKKSYDCLLNPIYSRDFYTDISLSKIIHAKQKIAPQGDCSNTPVHFKIQTDKIFNHLLKNQDGILFEFDRNKEFFEQFMQTKINTKLSMNPQYLPSLESLKQYFNIKMPYVILFIGASISLKKWSMEHFANIALYLINNYDSNIILCSGKEDIHNSKIITSQVSRSSENKIFNLVGKTSLLELGTLIYYADLLISNETSAPHLATALKTPCITLSNGNHLSRFTPSYENYHLILHPDILQNITYYQKASHQYGYQNKLDINEITPQSLYPIIDAIFKRKNNDPKHLTQL